MNSKEILDDISKHLTGDPEKDGPFLKEQSEKYKEHEENEAINRGLAKMLYEIVSDDYFTNLHTYLENENKNVAEQLENVLELYQKHSYSAGISVLEEIIKNNILAWRDTEEYTYKSFGSPLEYSVYLKLSGDEKEIRSVNCDMSEVYRLYGFGLIEQNKINEARDALEQSVKFNPVNPNALFEYSEILKLRNNMKKLREVTDWILKCAVTKDQLSAAYRNYAYYFVEQHDYKNAFAMVEMSRIFGDSKSADSEYEYVIRTLGMKPKTHTNQELMDIMLKENIQPGPSSIVVELAYMFGKNSEQNLDYKLAIYFYKVVYELLEEPQMAQHISELEQTVAGLEYERKNNNS